MTKTFCDRCGKEIVKDDTVYGHTDNCPVVNNHLTEEIRARQEAGEKPFETLEEEIKAILHEYPPHPSMHGAEDGMNIVTIDKLSELFASALQKQKERDAEIVRNEIPDTFQGNAQVISSFMQFRKADAIKQILK